ncbi:MAG TPA: V4R domain-containing protein [Chloroflexota bacterium]|nr:V4R domain-containing protein [Chloroflexota bacterium]
MATKPQPQPLELPLPLMYVAPKRSLQAVYLSADTLDRFEAVRQAASTRGVTVSLLYTSWDANHRRYQGALVLDQTDAKEPSERVIAAFGGVPGVTVLATQAPGTGLAAFERGQLDVAGTPMVAIARPFLGNTHRLLLESLGDRAAELLFQAGENAGQQAAAGVPALAPTLGLQLTPELIRQRFYDVQVFGWAKVVALSVDDRFVGEARLVDDFEALAWQGKATSSVCHWLRGFLTGATSSLTGHALQVSEPECQGKGDRSCRMVFREP